VEVQPEDINPRQPKVFKKAKKSQPPEE